MFPGAPFLSYRSRRPSKNGRLLSTHHQFTSSPYLSRRYSRNIYHVADIIIPLILGHKQTHRRSTSQNSTAAKDYPGICYVDHPVRDSRYGSCYPVNHCFKMTPSLQRPNLFSRIPMPRTREERKSFTVSCADRLCILRPTSPLVCSARRSPPSREPTHQWTGRVAVALWYYQGKSHCYLLCRPPTHSH